MKNKKMIILMLLILLTSGCTKILKDKDGNIVKNDETGSSLVQNILCKPNLESSIEVYNNNYNETLKSLDEKLKNNEITKKDYEKALDDLVNIDELESCSDFTIFGKYEGIWNTIFVRPLSWLIIYLGNFVNNYGLAIIIITLILRLILYPVTKKTAMQSENLNLAKKDLDRIEKKYKDKNDQESMMQKSQEMMVIYKKYNINPASGCIFSLIQIPIFFAFYESLNRLPVIIEGKLLGFELGLTPSKAIQLGEFHYIIFIILVVLVTYFSFKLNKTATGGGSDQERQMGMMMNVMVIFIGIASLSTSVAIALYWITNSGFTVVQNLLVKRGKKNENIIKNK